MAVPRKQAALIAVRPPAFDPVRSLGETDFAAFVSTSTYHRSRIICFQKCSRVDLEFVKVLLSWIADTCDTTWVFMDGSVSPSTDIARLNTHAIHTESRKANRI